MGVHSSFNIGILSTRSIDLGYNICNWQMHHQKLHDKLIPEHTGGNLVLFLADARDM